MKNIIFPFFVVSFSMLFISVLQHIILPFSYYFFSIVVSILLIIMIYRLGVKKEWVVILSIAIVCVFVRGLYPVASNFSLIPLDDGYRDYAVAKTFLETGQSFSLQSIGETISEQTSVWPILHILAVSLSEVLNLDLLYVVLVLPLIFSLVIFLFIYLLMKKIVLRLGLDRKVISLSLLIYTISPDNIYSSMQFVRQNIGIVFVMILFYLSYEIIQKNKSSLKLKLLFIIFSCVLVMSHNFSPFVMLLFFSLFFILTKTSKQILDKIRFKMSVLPIRSITVTMIIFFALMMFAWWVFYAPIVLEIYVPFLRGILGLNLKLAALDLNLIRWEHYPILRPAFEMSLLNLRDVAILVPPVIGFFAYVRRLISKKILTASDQFLLYSIITLVTILLVFQFILNVQPLRILWFSSPFLALFTALTYNWLIRNKTVLIRIFAVSLIILAVFSTFLSPFARGYLPRYLYDPTISFEEVGNHNPKYPNIVPFTTNYLQIDHFNIILSDDPDLLYIVLPSEFYLNIRNIHANPQLINETDVILFEFLELNPLFHAIPYLYLENRELIDNLESFKDQVTYKLNVVYSDGSSKIYVSPN